MTIIVAANINGLELGGSKYQEIRNRSAPAASKK